MRLMQRVAHCVFAVFVAFTLLPIPACAADSAAPIKMRGKMRHKRIRMERLDSASLTNSPRSEQKRLPIQSPWEIRSSTMSQGGGNDCLFSRGLLTTCTAGRFNSLYSATDGSRLILISMTGFTGPQLYKRIHFLSGDGNLLREVRILEGGVMISVFAPKAKRLFTLMSGGRDAVLISYDADGREVWKKILEGQAVASNDARMLQVTSDGRRLLVATNEDFKTGKRGKVSVFGLSGDSITEIDASNALLKVSPNERRVIIWDRTVIRSLDLQSDQEAPLMDLGQEQGVDFKVEDISSDGAKVLVSKMKRDGPSSKRRSRVENLIVVDVDADTVSEAQIDEEVEVTPDCKIGPDGRVEVRTRSRKSTYAIRP